jgi:predicted nucleic acid-binding protein
MAASVLVDAGFLIALLGRRETHHAWAAAMAARHTPPWKTCEAALSEAFFVLATRGTPALAALIRRGAVMSAFHLGEDADAVLALMHKYRNVPMSLADACLVRMTETLANAVLLTTDADFRIYRRHGRKMIACVLPE